MKGKEMDRLACDPTEDNVAILYNELNPLVCHIARKYARCPGDADDMAGELGAILLACLNAFKPDGGACFRTYFIRSIHHHFGKFYKKQTPATIEDVDWVAVEEDDLIENLFDCSYDDGTRASLLASEAAAYAEQLPEKHKEMIIHLLNGQSLDDVAEWLDISKKEATFRLKRALELIAIQLQYNAPRLLKDIPDHLLKRITGGDKPLFKEPGE